MIRKKQDDLNGMQLAGNNSMAEVLLWALILLPPVIAVNGAGVCFIHIGLFAGITFACLFLVKRLRSYRDRNYRSAAGISSCCQDLWLHFCPSCPPYFT